MGKKGSITFASLLVLLVLCWMQSMLFNPGISTASDAKKKIRIALSASLFSEVNLKDTKLAMEIWSRKLDAKLGYDYISETLFFKDLPSLCTAVHQRDVDLVQLLALEYLEMKDRELIEPLLVGVRNGSPYDRYVLLVHRDSAVRSLKQLKGVKFLVEPKVKGLLPKMWLDTLLLKEKLPPSDRFFSLIQADDMPSHLVLPVYFRQAEACLVSRSAYSTMIELNPKLGDSLVILKESPGLVFSFFCIQRNVEKKMREAVYESIRILDKEPEGKQILTIFRLDGIDFFKPDYLRPTEDLLREYRALAKKDK